MTGEPAVARACIDSPLPHLDRLFDYGIPDKLAEVVAVGSRVRVRFAGRLIGAIVCEVAPDSTFEGALTPIRSSAAVPSFTPEALSLGRAIADRHGGNLWDVLRLMAPPRVASVEKRKWPGRSVEGAGRLAEAERVLRGQAAGALAGVASTDRHVWAATPGRASDGPLPAAELLGISVRAVAAVSHDAGVGASAVIVVPDGRAIEAVLAVARAAGLTRWTARSGGDIAVIHSSDPPGQRYGSYLAGMRGEAPIVLGTRPAVLAPVPRLAHLILWDDGNSAYDEPHAPHPRVLSVAAIRAEREGAGLTIAGFAPSIAARALIEHGWAREVETVRLRERAATPNVTVLGRGDRDREGGLGWHWMPGVAWRAALAGLERGPVLILVPRSGYVRGLACAACREWAACRACGGLLILAALGADPVCLECEAVNADWHCPSCGGGLVSHVRHGVERIAEQLRGMAPGVGIAVSSSGTGILGDGAVNAGLVIATPGAVPAVSGGYAQAIVIDAGALVGPGLDGEEDAIRLLLGAAANVRPRDDGGALVVVGNLPEPVIRCVSTWSPSAWASEAYAERESLGLPPARRVIEVEGSSAALRAAGELLVGGTTLAELPSAREVTGRSGERVFLSARRDTQTIVDALRALQIDRSRSGHGDLRIRVDGPLEPAG
jgi:primosomal protein N' (replication factor Y)